MTSPADIKKSSLAPSILLSQRKLSHYIKRSTVRLSTLGVDSFVSCSTLQFCNLSISRKDIRQIFFLVKPGKDKSVESNA